MPSKRPRSPERTRGTSPRFLPARVCDHGRLGHLASVVARPGAASRASLLARCLRRGDHSTDAGRRSASGSAGPEMPVSRRGHDGRGAGPSRRQSNLVASPSSLARRGCSWSTCREHESAADFQGGGACVAASAVCRERPRLRRAGTAGPYELTARPLRNAGPSRLRRELRVRKRVGRAAGRITDQHRVPAVRLAARLARDAGPRRGAHSPASASGRATGRSRRLPGA